ncbi:hypothetical protein OG601_47115 [Streptomyces sp. NBC_01239]|uniref:hypothetical protein n=1 Tax=Streptomyces sp. NBC_01239 TaxID=2903792 RepID=UPI002256E008|nr:hypothetical protein [Streptomyces sp. NBC_01239]MCX4809036.1 hypothetical protein [Streptomyces sp. NBC_01239]MCX4818146.1 hypothetical protein [Streptomyces sp. NBC_01239]
MTAAQLFAEAVDALHALLLSGAVWLVLLCGAAGLAVYAVCVAVWALPSMAWQAVTAGLAAAAAARALGGRVTAVQGPEVSEPLPGPGERYTPGWAHDTDNPTDIGEAA